MLLSCTNRQQQHWFPSEFFVGLTLGRRKSIAASKCCERLSKFLSDTTKSQGEEGTARWTELLQRLVAAVQCESIDGGFEEVECTMQLQVAPCYAQQLKKGIAQHMNNLMFTSSEVIGGVPVTWHKVALRAKSTRIEDTDPALAVPLTVKFLSFSVTAGACLKGRVTQLSHSHIGLLVSGVFNAAISCEHLPSSWTFQANAVAGQDDTGGAWITKKGGGGLVVKEGSEVAFNVVNTRTANGVLMINGSIPDSRNGSSSSSSSSSMAIAETQSGSKKHQLEEEVQHKKRKKSKA